MYSILMRYLPGILEISSPSFTAAAVLGAPLPHDVGWPVIRCPTPTQAERLPAPFSARGERRRRNLEEMLKIPASDRIHHGDNDDVTKRVITQPNSFDVLDTEYFSLKKLVPSGNIFALRRQENQRVRQYHAGIHQGELPTQ